MGLEETIRSREKLEGILTAFDTFTAMGAEIEGTNIKPLPIQMRLVPYFIASAQKDYGLFEVSAKTEFFAFQHKEEQNQVLSRERRASVRIGNDLLEHTVEFDIDHDGRRNFFKENFAISFGEEGNEAAEYRVALYSADTQFKEGHDYNLINKIGAVIFVGERFFDGFKSRHKLGYDRERYDVKTSQYELAITPKFDVTTDNFDATAREIIGITNQVLKILNEKYSKNATYLMAPNMTDEAAKTPAKADKIDK